MSYDLFFRSPERPWSPDARQAFFSSRHGYELSGSAANYENADTGVYFAFSFEARDDGMSFNVNFFRPHVFALEAITELQAFVEHFRPAVVEDPQVDGVQGVGFNAEQFMRGWRAGNRTAVEIALSRGATLTTLPSATIEAAWRWNVERRARQASLGDTVFVPRVFFFLVEGAVRRVVVWPDVIPIALPEVDFVILHRDDVARQWMRRAEPVSSLAPHAQVVEVMMKDAPVQAGALPFRVYDPPSLEEHAVRFFVEAPEMAQGPVALKTEQVIDREVLDEVTVVV